ncbi:MAG: hypothetical protein KJP23_28060, partial [Deltaproteobacteria bacterium]|nr:hypothetical protein [Deltaproteobacteria bacterium]
MTSIIFIIAVAASITMAFIGLSYLISSLWEKESRAALYAGLQFLLMLGLAILLFYLEATGLFEAAAGRAVLILGLILPCGILALLSLKIGSNPKALQGTRAMMVGSVKRYDERDIVFA